MMATEWKEKTLGKCFNLVNETTNPGLIPQKIFSVYSIPGFDSGAPEQLTGETIQSNKFLVPEKSILFSKLNPSTPRVWRVSFPEDNAISSTEFLPLVPKSDIDYDFGYYLLLNPHITRQMAAAASGTSSSHQRIRPDDLLELEVELPPLDEQRSIAAILSSLDDKIELLRRQNETLEQVAQAIFNKWFIKPTADGVLPEGWREMRMDSLFLFEGGAQPPKVEHVYEPRAGYVRFIQNRDYSTDSHPTYIRESHKNRLCDELDIMMDKYGAVGTARYGIAGAYNVALAKIKPTMVHTREYLRSFFLQAQVRELLDASAAASTRGSLNKTTFAGLDVKIPPPRALEIYENMALALRKKVLHNRAQVKQLASARDALLPRLMSGEIRV